MSKFYITFMLKQVQQGYPHAVIIEAKGFGEARDKMVKAFGVAWAFVYTEKQWEKDFDYIREVDPAYSPVVMPLEEAKLKFPQKREMT